MTTFGWKRKAGEKLPKCSISKSLFNPDEDEFSVSAHSSHLIQNFKQKRRRLEENAKIKSEELRKEGVKMAEKEHFIEAIKLWDLALQLTPSDSKLLEMKAQVLLQLDQPYDAFQAARKSVIVDPQWWISYQTLGRAQLGIGEIKQAIGSFSRALHINPASKELYQDDLLWACQLLKEKEQLSPEDENHKDSTLLTTTTHEKQQEVCSPSIIAYYEMELDRPD